MRSRQTFRVATSPKTSRATRMTPFSPVRPGNPAAGHVHGRRRGARNALLIDARKAHMRAYVDEDVHVALPPEVSQPGMCAKLRRSLYGTRAAPARWEA
eukprot:1648166-Alexandrium_andersonii.AAC.1